MTSIEKSVIKTEAIFSEDRQHRYLLRKEWDKNKKKAMVLMVSPSYADGVITDTTTMCVVNNLYRLDYGGVDIVNLYSAVDGSRCDDEGADSNGNQNMDQIQASAAKVDIIIIAWGRAGETHKGIQERQRKAVETMKVYNDKLYAIQFHPLSPAMRKDWKIEKYMTE